MGPAGVFPHRGRDGDAFGGDEGDGVDGDGDGWFTGKRHRVAVCRRSGGADGECY